MSKKFLLIPVLIAVLCCAAAAFAEAEFTVTDKILITAEGDSEGFFFAKIENTGDTGAYTEWGGKLFGFSEDDDIILSEEYVSTSPSTIYLEPGDYAYIDEWIYESGLQTSTVVDYRFSIKAGTYGTKYTKQPCIADVQYSSSETSDNYVNVTIANVSSEILQDFYITSAIYDQNGELIYVAGDAFETLGITPGSTVIIKQAITRDVAAYFARNKLVPTTVDAILYIAEK